MHTVGLRDGESVTVSLETTYACVVTLMSGNLAKHSLSLTERSIRLSCCPVSLPQFGYICVAFRTMEVNGQQWCHWKALDVFCTVQNSMMKTGIVKVPKR